MNKIYQIYISFLLLWILLPLAGQDTKVVSDLGLWTGASVEKTFKKDWTLSFKQEVRLKHDISTLNNIFSQAGMRYRLNRNFALEGKYRITWDKKAEGDFEIQSRYSFDLRFKGRLDFISIYYRLRYQKEVEGMNLLSLDEPYEKYLRNRLSVRYTDFKKFEPFVSAEIFQLFEPNQYPSFHYMRFQAGVRYTPAKYSTFRLAYGLNHELNSDLPANIYMIRINYTFSF